MYRLVLLIALCAAGAVQAADLTVDPAVFRALDLPVPSLSSGIAVIGVGGVGVCGVCACGGCGAC